MSCEEIRFVVTPPCRLCPASDEIKRRYPCIGCSKKASAKNPPAQPGKIRKLRKIGQMKRDRKILNLRLQGLSFGEISKLLGLPRSTVFNAVKRNRKSGRSDQT